RQAVPTGTRRLSWGVSSRKPRRFVCLPRSDPFRAQLHAITVIAEAVGGRVNQVYVLKMCTPPQLIDKRTGRRRKRTEIQSGYRRGRCPDFDLRDPGILRDSVWKIAQN